jgi:hypothetical protein
MIPAQSNSHESDIDHRSGQWEKCASDMLLGGVKWLRPPDLAQHHGGAGVADGRFDGVPVF